jgi:hypothetical protein
MEEIFNNAGIGGNRSGAATLFDDGDQMSYHARLIAMIEDAVDYEQSYLQPAREVNQGYYYGEQPFPPGLDEDTDEDEAPNKSSFVSTDVRDTILTILPSLIRIFTASEKVAEFVPNLEENQAMADQAYDYINYVFYEENDGFLILHSVFKDALTVKAGTVRWWTDTTQEVTEQTYRGITQEQLQMLISENEHVQVVDGEVAPDGQTISHVTLRYVVSKPQHRVIAIPPEEFRISRYARSLSTSRLIGHEWDKPVSECIAEGMDPEVVSNYVSPRPSFSDERFLRNPGLSDDFRNTYETVPYGEWYIRIDGDNDGVDELRHICTIGNDYLIVTDEVVPYHNFALFSPDPRPHTVIGDSVADLVKDIQRIKSFMIRGMLDNLAESTNPKMVVNQLNTNIEDALNDDVGALIRTNGDPNAAVAFSKVPYVGADLQGNIDYLDSVRASRTGITEASKGLDPKAMQSTALSGIDAIVSGAQERIELIARILAETGLKDMLRGLLREITNNPNPQKMIQLRGQWQNVNPSLFDPTMKVKVNPTLGKGSDMIRLQALQMVAQVQETVISKYGIQNNPLVGPIEFRNTQADMLALVNIKNVSRYFKPITSEQVQMIDSTPKEPDPASVMAQAEMEKVKAGTVKAIATQGGKAADQNFKLLQLKMDDDFRRDKLNVDATVAAADAVAKDGAIITPIPGLLAMNEPNDSPDNFTGMITDSGLTGGSGGGSKSVSSGFKSTGLPGGLPGIGRG